MMKLVLSRRLAVLRKPLPSSLAILLSVALVGAGAAATAGERGESKRVATDAAFRQTVLPTIRRYCLDCHGAEDPEGDVSFAGIESVAHVDSHRKTWEKAYRFLGIDAMPPRDCDERPSLQEREAVVRWLDLKLHHADCDVVDDAGMVTLHRLNRVEYNNTVRDLLGIDIDPAKDFPSDDVGYGFSNIADVPSLPPLLLEKYVDAAERIAEAAIVSRETRAANRRFTAGELKVTGAAHPREQWVHLISRGSVYCEVDVPLTGEYLVRIEAAADQAGPELAKMEVRVDGKALQTFEIRGHRKPKEYKLTCRLERGRHRIEAIFLNDYYAPNAKNPKDRDRNLGVRFIELEGAGRFELPEHHRRIIVATPGPDKTVAQAAREILMRLMPRAFRRPVDSAEVDRMAGLVEFAVERGDSFERGVQVALEAILLSPHFLFRVEEAAKDTGKSQPIGQYELASRLSYFLWSSMPDDELFDLAAAGKLQDTRVLQQQVDRMLKDPRADALVDNFASQWLNLSNLVEVQPDKELFPEFTPELRRDMVTETKLFARAVFREDRSLLDFLDADFTFVNERLAKHYGIPGVKGPQMRRVSLPGGQRAGVLTHASILTLTSNPNRTSLVRRGAWVLDNILGVKLPDPPAVVQSLEEGAKKSGAKTLREQLRLHREMPTCAACHDTLDPIGFGFENFDPIGRWRTKAEGMEVDSRGTLPSGESFSGPVELVRVLKRRKDSFARLVTRKMLTYALGRGLTINDTCAIDEILDDLKRNDYRFTVLVHGIVQSKPFRMRGGNALPVPSHLSVSKQESDG